MEIAAKDAWLVILGFLKAQNNRHEVEMAVELINKHFKIEDGN